MAHEPRRERGERGGREERDSEFTDKLVHINRVAKVVGGRPPFRLCCAGGGGRPERPSVLVMARLAKYRKRSARRPMLRQPDARSVARRPHAASRCSRPSRRGQGIPARCASGHGHYRRWSDARGVRNPRHAGCCGEIARLVESLQRGAGDLRCAQAPGFTALSCSPPQYQGVHLAVAPPRRRRGSGG